MSHLNSNYSWLHPDMTKIVDWDKAQTNKQISNYSDLHCKLIIYRDLIVNDILLHCVSNISTWEE